jgi:hypothetical protein
MFVITADQIGGRSGTEQATDDPGAALDLVLRLTRERDWYVGLGVDEPSGAEALARAAALSARKRPTRFSLAIATGRLPDSELLGPLIDLLLQLRARRTPEGWALADLLQSGITQAEAASQLGVTPQAVSLRAQNAHLRLETSAVRALTELLDAAGAPPQRRTEAL